VTIFISVTRRTRKVKDEKEKFLLFDICEQQSHTFLRTRKVIKIRKEEAEDEVVLFFLTLPSNLTLELKHDKRNTFNSLLIKICSILKSMKYDTIKIIINIYRSNNHKNINLGRLKRGK
jgi:hypothetical protein